MKWIIRILLLLLVLLVAYMVVRVFQLPSKQLSATPIEPKTIQEARWLDFSKRSTSPQILLSDSLLEEPLHARALKKDSLIFSLFPLVDSFLHYTPISGNSSLYQWPGKDPELDPILILAEKSWLQADSIFLQKERPMSAFSEKWKMKEGMQAFAVLESMEILLSEGFQPNRGIYIALVDEEASEGVNGAISLAHWLESKSARFEYLLGSGPGLEEGISELYEGEIIKIGIAEKGCAHINLLVNDQGEVSPLSPGEGSASQQLIRALNAIHSTPFPIKEEVVFNRLEEYLAPEGSFLTKFQVANRWLFSPLLRKKYEQQPALNTMMRTTAQAIHVQLKSEEQPGKASAQIIAGILPGDSIEGVLTMIKERVNNPEIEISLSPEELTTESPTANSTSSFGFNVLQKTLSNLYPKAIVAPVLVPEVSNARHFGHLAEDVYLFCPVRAEQGAEIQESTQFYYNLIKNSAQ